MVNQKSGKSTASAPSTASKATEVASKAAEATKAAVEAIQKSASKASTASKVAKVAKVEKKEESVVPEATSAAEASASEAGAARKRREVTRETVEQSFDELLGQIDKEVDSLRQDGNKGTRFLRSVAKTIRQLKSDSLRLSVKRTRRQSAPRSTNSGFMKPVKISKEMQKFTGIKDEQLVSRVDVTKAICSYVKEHNLQNTDDRRQFTPDEKLSKLLGTTQPLTYYNLQKHIQQHFIKTA